MQLSDAFPMPPRDTSALPFRPPLRYSNEWSVGESAAEPSVEPVPALPPPPPDPAEVVRQWMYEMDDIRPEDISAHSTSQERAHIRRTVCGNSSFLERQINSHPLHSFTVGVTVALIAGWLAAACSIAPARPVFRGSATANRITHALLDSTRSR